MAWCYVEAGSSKHCWGDNLRRHRFDPLTPVYGYPGRQFLDMLKQPLHCLVGSGNPVQEGRFTGRNAPCSQPKTPPLAFSSHDTAINRWFPGSRPHYRVQTSLGRFFSSVSIKTASGPALRQVPHLIQRRFAALIGLLVHDVTASYVTNAASNGLPTQQERG